jgi:hypothetical protein
LGEVEGGRARSGEACGEVGGAGELDFSDSKFCSSLFPPFILSAAAAAPSPPLPAGRSPARSYRQCVPTVNHRRRLTTIPGGSGGGGGGSQVSPSGRAGTPVLPLPPPTPTPTSHSFLRSSRRSGLALFFLSSAHGHPRRPPVPVRALPSHPRRPAPLSLSITICSSASTWRGPTDQTSGTADTIKTGKKSDGRAHISRSRPLALFPARPFLSRAAFSLPLHYLRLERGPLAIPDAFDKLFTKRPTRFLERHHPSPFCLPFSFPRRCR